MTWGEGRCEILKTMNGQFYSSLPPPTPPHCAVVIRPENLPDAKVDACRYGRNVKLHPVATSKRITLLHRCLSGFVESSDFFLSSGKQHDFGDNCQIKK